MPAESERGGGGKWEGKGDNLTLLTACRKNQQWAGTRSNADSARLLEDQDPVFKIEQMSSITGNSEK